MKLKTKEYSKFKFLSKNREIKNNNFNIVEKSILQKNLLHLAPIIVDKNFFVIDGQHRLRIAEKHGLDIYYEIHEDFKSEDLILLNNQLQWQTEDYLRFYVNSGNENYIKFENFMRRYNTSFKVTFVLLFGNSHVYSSFKKGELIFPNDEEIEKIVSTYDFVKDIINIVRPKILGPKGFLESSSFYRALYLLCSIEYFDKEIFVKKLAYRLDLLRPCMTTKNYINLFKKIYNYRNNNPLKIDDDINEIN